MKTLTFPIVIAFLPLLCNSQAWDDEFRLNYSYDPEASNGPDSWATVKGIGQWDLYNNLLVQQFGNQCGSSNRPSPVNLEGTYGTCPDIHELLMRQISENDCTRKDIKFELTPYSLRGYYPLSDKKCQRPTLILPGRRFPYVLLWIEVHARSEHLIEGTRYDAELQMMHVGTGNLAGQLLAVSVMIESSSTSDNLEMEWLLEQWKDRAMAETESCDPRKLRQVFDVVVESSSPASGALRVNNIAEGADTQRELQFSASPCTTDRFGNGCEPLGPRRRMYPYSLWPSIWYYGYMGGLTSPPCTEIVQWRIIDEPMRISRRQYKEITLLLTMSKDDSCGSDTATSPTGENNRPVQPINSIFQSVYRCTPNDFGYFVYTPDEQ